MTIQEAIDHVDKMRPNQFEQHIKVGWLSKLDGMIFREVFMTHKGCHCKPFKGYSESDMDTELLVPDPYDENIYNFYLQAMIDKENAEFGRYNQSITLYNNAYKSFQDYYNRTHMPIPVRHFIY